MLEHGGRLRRAARHYGIPPADWLDLSTGISPWSWLDERAIELPREAWLRLPEDDDGLEPAARDYYGAEALPVAGSQAAIQMLPRLRAAGRVGVLMPSYAEHAEHWTRCGHVVVPLQPREIDAAIASLDVLLLVNPNNPTGHRFTREQLLGWHARLQRRGGWLVVDEAFIDAEADASLAPESAREGLIVLRSLGKFFGLAGARVGFVLCGDALRTRLRDALGPWAVSGPSRYVAMRALQDEGWQAQQRQRLRAAGDRLRVVLHRAGLEPDGGCALFQWRRTNQAAQLHEALARLGILSRWFEPSSSLRFGLPASDAQWQRLQFALDAIPLSRVRERGAGMERPSPAAGFAPLAPLSPHAGEGSTAKATS